MISAIKNTSRTIKSPSRLSASPGRERRTSRGLAPKPLEQLAAEVLETIRGLV